MESASAEVPGQQGTGSTPPIDVRSIALRPAGPEDEAFLYELYCSTRLDDLAVWALDPVRQETVLKLQFTAQQQSYRAQFPQADHSLILMDARPVGRLIIDRTEQAILGVDIALLPEHRSAGIGTAVIQDLLTESARAGKPFRLHVVKTNRAARLYRRLGISTIGDSGSHLLMEWRPGTSSPA
jgi:GNAT superfamily N-acetyltransferase